MRIQKFHVFCVHSSEHVEYGSQMSGIIVLNIGQSVFEKHMRNCQMSVVQRNTFTYHMEEMTGNTFIYL